eukprot:5824150-Pleurochrysis_carterae.AAC.1
MLARVSNVDTPSRSRLRDAHARQPRASMLSRWPYQIRPRLEKHRAIRRKRCDSWNRFAVMGDDERLWSLLARHFQVCASDYERLKPSQRQSKHKGRNLCRVVVEEQAAARATAKAGSSEAPCLRSRTACAKAYGRPWVLPQVHVRAGGGGGSTQLHVRACMRASASSRARDGKGVRACLHATACVRPSKDARVGAACAHANQRTCVRA